LLKLITVTKNKSLILILFLLIALVASVTLVFRTVILVGRASSGSSSSVALENSYLFASPLRGQANGQELIRITVFLLDGRGIGVANQSVDIHSQPQKITVNPVQSVSDSFGKTVFDLSSASAGQFEISATVNAAKSLPQKVKIVFY